MASYTITSQIDKIPEATTWIEEHIKESFNQHKLDQIRLVCHEAIINAIVHGNKNIEAKKVVINFIKEENRIGISIDDEGEGYNIKEHKYNIENLLEENGRGILIIQQYTDEIEYQGKTLFLYFNY